MCRPEQTAQIVRTVFKAEGFLINHTVIQRKLPKIDMAPSFELGLTDYPAAWAESLTLRYATLAQMNMKNILDSLLVQQAMKS